MNPRYREMLLGEDFTPLSELSSAFLRPKSALHVQFAYYESSLAVEFLIERFGMEMLKTVLDDLAEGIPLNDAMEVRTSSSIEDLDGAFALFARERAELVAPKATWEELELPPRADSGTIAAWLDEHPQSFYGVQRLAAAYLAEQKWDDAIEAAKRMKELYPEYVGPQSAHEILATAYVKQGETDSARDELESLASRDGSALTAYSKLMDIAEAGQDWETVAKNAQRYLAVNPLVAEPYRRAARAAEELDDVPTAIDSYRALSQLDDTDPAGVHFRLAKLLEREDEDDEALRQVLMSLEEAPRFRDAQRLLIELVEADTSESGTSVITPVEAPIP
jgi:tetratricopeptide (TPR) repeat protein